MTLFETLHEDTLARITATDLPCCGAAATTFLEHRMRPRLRAGPLGLLNLSIYEAVAMTLVGTARVGFLDHSAGLWTLNCSVRPAGDTEHPKDDHEHQAHRKFVRCPRHAVSHILRHGHGGQSQVKILWTESRC